MRGVALAVLLAGCGHVLPATVIGPEIELALDEGRPDQRPLIPGKAFEVLLRVDPKMPAFRATRMRFQMAQPGHITFTIYASDAEGHPGAALKTIDRGYGPETVSSADDGKWVIEDLSDLPLQRAPIFVGISSPEKNGDPRLWATSNDSGNAFQRDADPSVPLASLKIPRTPRLRVSFSPSSAP